MSYILTNKGVRLFIGLGGFFIANALIAEFIGVKIFSLEKTLGLEPLNWTLFGQEGLSFNLTTGVLLWPVVFVMTDIINEYFGRKGVRFLSFMAAGLILYAFVMFYLGIHMPPADFWPGSHIRPDWPAEVQQDMRMKVGDYNSAFALVFGQGLWIIAGSLVAFLIGQFVDVITFHRIKRLTGEKMIWLRATGSTVVSQFVDSFVVLLIAFYIGAGWDLRLVLAIGLVNYIYKFFMAVALTPALYVAHAVIDRYLGDTLADELKRTAMAKG
jgi:uncharacterized PurR-regulated membrane protein YhhQ (DUF165 family)